MIDSNEKVQAQVDTQTSGVSIQSEDAATELKKKELNKRALVEQEIKEHPIFKSMQKSLEGTQVKLDIDDIVDKYFDLTSDKNILDNKEFYKVNPDVILQSLQETMYIISSEENGIVLDNSGEMDKEASRAQQEAAIYTEALKRELRSEEKENIYEQMLAEMNEKMENQINNFFDLGFSKSHELVSYILSENEKCPLSQEEWIQVTKKIVQGKELIESEEKLEDELLIENEKDFITIFNALKYTSMININSKNYSKMAKFINEIKANDEKNRFIDEETGEFSARKVEEFALNYYAKFTIRNSAKELKDFCQSNEKYEAMDSKSQRILLTAIYSLYKMPACHERDIAIMVMGRISPNSIDKDGIINKEKFLNLYNATENGTRTFKQMESAIARKNYSNMVTFMRTLRDQMRDGNFPTIDIPIEATPEEIKELKREFKEKMKQKDKPKFHRDTHEKIENEIDRLIKKNNLKGDRNDLVVAAYKKMYYGKSLKSKNCSEYLKEHIEGLASTYGKYIDDGKLIKRRNLEVESEEVEKIVNGLLKFKENEDRIQEKRFSFAKIKTNLKDMRTFIKDGIQYAGNQFKNLFKKTVLSLPQGNEQDIITKALFGTVEKNEDEASKEEIFTMTEEIAKVEADSDLEKLAQKEMQKEAQELIKDSNEDAGSTTAHVEINDNNFFKKGITQETLENIAKESERGRINLEKAESGQLQQDEQAIDTSGGER